MTYRWITLIVAITFCITSLTSSAASLEENVENCVGCHGSNGVSECLDMPTIAGISAGSHEDAMFTYLDEARPCAESEFRHGDTSRSKTDMCKITKALTEDEIIELATYFAEQKFVPMKQGFDAAKAKAGEAIHNRDCKRCHSDGGSNPDDDASIIAGQPIPYLEQTFKDYRSGEREQPKKMKVKMDALSDAEYDALVHYYASQQ